MVMSKTAPLQSQLAHFMEKLSLHKEPDQYQAHLDELRRDYKQLHDAVTVMIGEFFNMAEHAMDMADELDQLRNEL